MTIAAVILAATPESALADADGQPRVRRLVDVAWAGGAVPIVVVAPDPDGAVATALADAPATLAAPAPFEAGPVGQIVRGIEVARDEVTGTDGVLIWPARMTWVDPETVTSLIEAHGVWPAALLRPTFGSEPGWPVLLPMDHAAAFGALGRDRMPDDLVADLVAGGVPERRLDLGDPGTVHDGATPRAELPPYDGPPQPAGGHAHEWGSAAAERTDDIPLEGPGLAPFGQAATDDPEDPS